MKRTKSGVLGLAFVAVLAMSAVTASAAQATPLLEASKYWATIEATGENVGENFHTEAGAITCKVSHYTATLSAASSTLTVHPTYTECQAFGLFTATVNTEECNYVFHATEKVSADNYRAHVDVVCPAGQSIKWSATPCKWEYKAQTGLTTVDIVDNTGLSPNDISIQPTLLAEKAENRNGKNGPLAYTVTADGFGCPLNGTGAKTGAEYSSTSGITAIATAPAGTQVSLKVTGE